MGHDPFPQYSPPGDALHWDPEDIAESIACKLTDQNPALASHEALAMATQTEEFHIRWAKFLGAVTEIMTAISPAGLFAATPPPAPPRFTATDAEQLFRALGITQERVIVSWRDGDSLIVRLPVGHPLTVTAASPTPR